MAIVVVAAACTHLDATRWVSDARETVRYRYEQMWLPVPDAASGFTLRLSLDATSSFRAQNRDSLVPVSMQRRSGSHSRIAVRSATGCSC